MSAQEPSPIPADDKNRTLTLVHPDDEGLRHVGIAGGTYTILVSGAQTDGRYCLIDMLVPGGGGPPAHRHDFEEMFTLLEGELQFTFRGETKIAGAGTTVNIPANAPHAFKNLSDRPARMLCMCLPAGQDEFFLEVGVPVAGRTAAAPRPSDAEAAQKKDLVQRLLPKYRTEMVG